MCHSWCELLRFQCSSVGRWRWKIQLRKFVEDSGGVHLKVVLNEIVFDNVVGAGKPIQSHLGPLPVNMASLGTQVLFMALFIYFSYKVYSSIHKFQRQGMKLHLVFTVVLLQ